MGDVFVTSSSGRNGAWPYYPNETTFEKMGERNFIRYNRTEDGPLAGVYIIAVQAYSYTQYSIIAKVIRNNSCYCDDSHDSVNYITL